MGVSRMRRLSSARKAVWPPVSPFGLARPFQPGGRLGCTAMAALMLESYYRYVPVYRDTRREIARLAATPATAAPPDEPPQDTE